jgi:hypothetical protein
MVAIMQKIIYLNFGYILDMKVKKEMESFLYSWLPIGTYHKNSGNLNFYFLFYFKIWRI